MPDREPLPEGWTRPPIPAHASPLILDYAVKVGGVYTVVRWGPSSNSRGGWVAQRSGRMLGHGWHDTAAGAIAACDRDVAEGTPCRP